MAVIDGRAVCTTAPCSAYANFDGLECVVTCVSNLYEVLDNGEKRCALDCAHWYYANVHGKCTRKNGWLAAAIVCPIIVVLIIIILVIILLVSRKRQREMDIMRMQDSMVREVKISAGPRSPAPARLGGSTQKARTSAKKKEQAYVSQLRMLDQVNI